MLWELTRDSLNSRTSRGGRGSEMVQQLSLRRERQLAQKGDEFIVLSASRLVVLRVVHVEPDSNSVC